MADSKHAYSFDQFLSYCHTTQPEPLEAIRRFFKGVVGFPYDKELLLQAYLFLNIQRVFPQCETLLLFEKPPYGGYTNIGKCDFVYLTQDQRIFLIETKFIDTEASGDTERKRRNKHRNKVVNQVLSLRETFRECWTFDPDQIDCAIFTTDPSLTQRSREAGVISQFIATQNLFLWLKRHQDLHPEDTEE